MNHIEFNGVKVPLWETCGTCKRACEDLANLVNACAHMGLKLSAPGQREPKSLNRVEIAPGALQVLCHECKNKRILMTATGKQLAELVVAEMKREEDSGVDLNNPPNFEIEGEKP